MEGPIDCCKTDNLFFENTVRELRGKELRETWLQCRLCGRYHELPLAGFPAEGQLQKAIKELVKSDVQAFLRLKVLFSAYDEKSPVEKYRAYYNMWIWLKHGPVWEQSASPGT